MESLKQWLVLVCTGTLLLIGINVFFQNEHNTIMFANASLSQETKEIEGKTMLCTNNSASFSDLTPRKTRFEGVLYLGCIHPQRNYSVFSIVVDGKRTGLNYLFYAPLTAMAWKRISFNSVIVVSIVNVFSWSEDPLLRLVLETALKQEAFVLFLVTEYNHTITVAQSGRFVAPAIIHELCPQTSNIYMLTTDADLWPLNVWWYLMPNGYLIHSTNSFCCGYFTRHKMKYMHLPMSSIGMELIHWTELLSPVHWDRRPPLTARDIVRRLIEEFGPSAGQYIIKPQAGWYNDEQLCSYLIKLFLINHGDDVIHLSRGRIIRHDRINWNPTTIFNYTDAHLPLNPEQKGIWERKVMKLVHLMYDESTWIPAHVDEYASKFRAILGMSTVDSAVLPNCVTRPGAVYYCLWWYAG
ncbi:hypothetical protein CAPTEDRAFT_201460 [Capitella teleta]|uniref:Uncharacterized protein n=1 Tax=Capitella teleta TaxID=283909 RepID=R7TP35_CAPTE|nr:hypothetical protein CAPTEDRAFT_201460 [Capitella teleta]|eukprot:ELT95302.1 hypothetical protein CAPTEDRAFT_201460 [Capitella teleta]